MKYGLKAKMVSSGAEIAKLAHHTGNDALNWDEKEGEQPKSRVDRDWKKYLVNLSDIR